MISFPSGTEMVQFPEFRFSVLCVQTEMTGHHTGRVTPFGNRRIAGCVLLPVAFRSLPRPSSPGGSKASSVDPSSLDHMSISQRSRFRVHTLACIHTSTIAFPSLPCFLSKSKTTSIYRRACVLNLSTIQNTQPRFMEVKGLEPLTPRMQI